MALGRGTERVCGGVSVLSTRGAGLSHLDQGTPSGAHRPPVIPRTCCQACPSQSSASGWPQADLGPETPDPCPLEDPGSLKSVFRKVTSVRDSQAQGRGAHEVPLAPKVSLGPEGPSWAAAPGTTSGRTVPPSILKRRLWPGRSSGVRAAAGPLQSSWGLLPLRLGPAGPHPCHSLHGLRRGRSPAGSGPGAARPTGSGSSAVWWRARSRPPVQPGSAPGSAPPAPPGPAGPSVWGPWPAGTRLRRLR